LLKCWFLGVILRECEFIGLEQAPGNGIPAKVPGDLEAGSGWITSWVTTVYGLCVGTSSVGSWELVLHFELMSRVECEREENDFLCLPSPF